MSQRERVGASVTSAKVRRVLCQGEVYTQIVREGERQRTQHDCSLTATDLKQGWRRQAQVNHQTDTFENL